MISALFQQNENLGGIFEKILDNVSANEFDKSTNAKATKKNGTSKAELVNLERNCYFLIFILPSFMFFALI